MATQNFSHVPKNLIQTADYLRGNDKQLKKKDGVFSGRRATYFKGKAAVSALTKEPYAKHMKLGSPLEDKSKAEEVLSQMLQHKLFVKVDKGSKKQLSLSKEDPSTFDIDAYYTWIYEGSPLKSMLIGILVLLVVFAGVMFPLWPPSMRQGVYYLSLGILGLLGLFMLLAVVRLIIYILSRLVLGTGGWLYPNLFADVGVIESFIPLWEWEKKTSSKPSSSSKNSKASSSAAKKEVKAE